MRWKRIAWSVGLAPFLGGCHTVYHSPHGVVAEHVLAKSDQEITREIHRKALDAWHEVRCEFPRKVFSAEFRDGFLDGYTDYLDRGGDAQPPAVPPPRYTQNKKYFTPEGHLLIRDYFLGFKYGTDVAVATGQRQYLTVPVLIPDSAEAITEVPAQPVASPPPISKSDRPVPPLPIDPLQPLPSPRPMPKPPGQENGKTAPRVPALETLDPGVTKFGRIGSVPVPETSKGPKPPSVPSLPPNVPDAPKPIKQSNYEIPAPPKEVPNLPDDVPTPPVFDEIAPLPVIHETPAPLPFIHPEPTKK